VTFPWCARTHLVLATAQHRDAYWLDSPHLRYSLPSCVCTGARDPSAGLNAAGGRWRTAMLWDPSGAVEVSLFSVR